MGLSPEVKKVAHTLVHTPKTSMLQAVDCSKMDAYKLLQGAFETLSLNITAENATIHAHDAAVRICLCFRVHLPRAPVPGAACLACGRSTATAVRPAKAWGRTGGLWTWVGRKGSCQWRQGGRNRAHGARRRETRRRSWLERKLRRWRRAKRRSCWRAGGAGRRSALRALFVRGVLAGSYRLSGRPRRLRFYVLAWLALAAWLRARGCGLAGTVFVGAKIVLGCVVGA